MRFAAGEYYHIVNRGVDGRAIFINPEDYVRFLKGLHIFNSSQPKELRFSHSEIRSPRAMDGKKLVDVVSYCLMKNHVHVLLKAVHPEKTALFLQKNFIGYTMYFNLKYKRRGVLFQGRTKAKHINEGVYLDHILRYIHLNPLDYHDRRWREHGVKDIRRAKTAVLNYPWSSIKGVVGDIHDPILNLSIVRDLVPSKKEFIHDLLSWSSDLGDPISEELE